MGVVYATGRSNISPVRDVVRESFSNVLTDNGVSSSKFLGAVGYDVGNFAGDGPGAYPCMADLLRKASEFADCEHFGILLGQAGGRSLVGGLGPEISRAPTVRAALTAMRSEFRAQERGAIVELTMGDMACLSYIIVDPAVDSGAVISDVAAAVALRILAELCGLGWSPELVELSRRPPRDCRPYRRLFKCPIAFNATVTAIHFKGSWLDRPLAAGCNLAVADVEAPPCPAGAPDVVERVIQQLAHSIASGAAISASKVARLFGMCGRTLQRELTKAQTSYRSISDDVRFGMAKRLLQDTDMPVTEVALALGYADVSVLTRAFTRWSGTCPSEWRSSNQRHFRRLAGAQGVSIRALGGARAPELKPLRA